MRNLNSLFFILIFFSILTSCDELLLENDISEKNVQLLAPFNEAIIEGNEVYFSWENLEGADSFVIQVVSPSFSNSIRYHHNDSVSLTSFTASLESGHYEWRVRAENSAYQSEFSDAFRFQLIQDETDEEEEEDDDEEEESDEEEEDDDE